MPSIRVFCRNTVVKESWTDPFKDKPSYPIKHRKVDNWPEDKMYPILNPAEYNHKIPREDLPKRKPHYKV